MNISQLDEKTIDTQYTRVLPRDLFNEAKLLKCMGRLCLLIHDGETPVEMSMADSDIASAATGYEEGFRIGLIETGELTIVNLSILIKGKPYLFKTTYNSKNNYPLYLEYDYCDYLVFDELGNWDEEFVSFVNTL